VPIYAYTCATCGSFDVWRPAVEASEGHDCPSCGAFARRCFTPPGVARMSRPLFRAREREETSAHAPEVAAMKSGRPMPHGHGHSPAPPWAVSSH
jgi:putative FmdB family regulatory protein